MKPYRPRPKLPTAFLASPLLKKNTEGLVDENNADIIDDEHLFARVVPTLPTCPRQQFRQARGEKVPRDGFRKNWRSF